jgi:hypothetical protein
MALKDIRKALRAFVTANGGVAALAGVRMFPVKLPQGENRDSIVFNEISGIGDHHNEGASGLVTVRMQIGCWSQTADGAHVLFLAVKEAIDGYRGLMGDISVQGVFIDGWRDIDDTMGNMRGKISDYKIVYAER